MKIADRVLKMSRIEGQQRQGFFLPYEKGTREDNSTSKLRALSWPFKLNLSMDKKARQASDLTTPLP